MHNPTRRSLRPDDHPSGSTRRTFLRNVLGIAGAGVLGTGALSTLAGCDLLSPGGARQPHALDGFLAATVNLGAMYDATLTAVPELTASLTPVRDAHRAHVAALAAELGATIPEPAAAAGPPPTDRTEAIAALAAAEKPARDEAMSACLSSSARLAPLLGSIAAARASHVEVLK